MTGPSTDPPGVSSEAINYPAFMAAQQADASGQGSPEPAQTLPGEFPPVSPHGAESRATHTSAFSNAQIDVLENMIQSSMGALASELQQLASLVSANGSIPEPKRSAAPVDPSSGSDSDSDSDFAHPSVERRNTPVQRKPTAGKIHGLKPAAKEDSVSALRQSRSRTLDPDSRSSVEQEIVILRQKLADAQARFYGDSSSAPLVARPIRRITADERKSFKADNVGFFDPPSGFSASFTSIQTEKNGVFTYYAVKPFTDRVRIYTHRYRHSPIQENLERLLRGNAAKWWRTLPSGDIQTFATAENGVELYCKALERVFAMPIAQARKLRASIRLSFDELNKGKTFQSYMYDLTQALEAERGRLDQFEIVQIAYEQMAAELKTGIIPTPLRDTSVAEFTEQCRAWEDQWHALASRKANKTAVGQKGRVAFNVSSPSFPTPGDADSSDSGSDSDDEAEQSEGAALAAYNGNANPQGYKPSFKKTYGGNNHSGQKSGYRQGNNSHRRDGDLDEAAEQVGQGLSALTTGLERLLGRKIDLSQYRPSNQSAAVKPSSDIFDARNRRADNGEKPPNHKVMATSQSNPSGTGESSNRDESNTERE